MTTFPDLTDATYVAVETFRKNGKGVKTPVWITAEGDKHYCWTVADSGKVKRIRNNPEVNLAICDGKGNLKSDWVSAKAQVLDSPADVATQTRRMIKKFGILFRLFQFMGMIRRTEHVAIQFSPAT